MGEQCLYDPQLHTPSALPPGLRLTGDWNTRIMMLILIFYILHFQGMDMIFFFSVAHQKSFVIYSTLRGLPSNARAISGTNCR